MDAFEKVRNYIKKEELILKNDKITIGVSGGADSVCLLLMLHKLKKEYNLQLYAVHVDHMVRKDSKEDAEFVSDLCSSLDIPVMIYEENVEEEAVKNKCSVEEAGRNIRYQLFEKNAYPDGKIAVAHNKNDVAETLLLNITRGCKGRGLESIKNKNKNIIRPILCLTRTEIEEYLKENHQEYKTDYTNFENVYNRNKIRNIVIPELKNINEKAVENITNAVEYIKERNNFIDELVEDFIEKNVSQHGNTTNVKLKNFLEEKEYLQKEIIFKLLELHIPGNKNVSTRNVEDILENINKEGTKQTHLMDDVIVKKEHGLIKIYKEKEVSHKETLLVGENETEFGTYTLEMTKDMTISYELYEKTVDYGLLKNLEIGYIHDDLKIVLNGKEMKLRQYFNSEKILGNTPVIFDGQDVVWVVGHRLSEKYLVTDDTDYILKIKKD